MKVKKQTGSELNIVIARPNAFSYSETFIDAHILKLKGNIKTIYGGHFPVFDHQDKFIIKNPLHLAWYMFSKRILKLKNIKVRSKALSTYFIKNETDVVLAEYGVTGALIWKACKNAGVPLVIHFHGFDASDKRTIKEYGPFYSDAFEYASSIIAVSAQMKQSLIELGANPEKVHYLNYGVDLDLFLTSKLLKSPVTFLAVARFAEKKAPHHTITAFKKVNEQYSDSRLIMAGDGLLFEKSKLLARQLKIEDQITFKGKQNPTEVAALMQNATVFVQHSVQALSGDSEGTPNSILEASASALPIVSTRHAGIPEAVIQGETGFLVEEHDVTGMSNAMLTLARNPEIAKKMGIAGREHISKNYNQMIQIEKLDQILMNAYKGTDFQ